MKQKMMKQYIYILFLFIGWGQVAQAQPAGTLKTERLELRLEPGLVDFISFSPCGKEWFQAQRDAWKPALDKDMRNERVWENYYLACQGIWNGDTLLWKKEQPRLMKKMKKYIPDTRVYYKALDNKIMIPDKEEREAVERKIISLQRTSEWDYRDDISYYRRHGQMDKAREVAREWFDSGLYSRSILNYYYNVFAGLEKNAILVEKGPEWTYCVLLQYGVGLFKEVEIVDLSELMYPETESEFWKTKGIDVQEFPSRDEVKCPGAWYFTEKEKRPVYIQFSGNRYNVEKMKDFLYSEGLVFRYSLQPYDNMAVLRRNYEQIYLLDYLQSPVVTDISRGEDMYVLSFLPLLQFYCTSGDTNQYLKLKKLLTNIVDRMEYTYYENKPWVKAEMAAYLKLYKMLFDYIKAKHQEGETSISIHSFKEEYQKEYQQLIEMVKP